jgi:hypothetical protein
MYYNNSTFPLYLFKFNFEDYNVDEMFSNILFVIEQDTFVIDFSKSISEKKMQDLFSYLSIVLPPLILSGKKFQKDIFFKNSSINNHILFQELADIRLDIKKIYSTLDIIENDPLCIGIDKTSLIKELIVFVYQYVFIELGKIIVATNINGKDYFFDIKNDSKKAVKYSNELSLGSDRVVAQKNFIKSYSLSFDNIDDGSIKKLESELIFMSKNVNQKKRLRSIVENNIKYSEGISRKNKYRINKYLFASFISKFFFPKLKSKAIDDFEMEEAYFNFIKSTSR